MKARRWIGAALISALVAVALAVSLATSAVAVTNAITEFPLPEPPVGVCSHGGLGIESGRDSCITAGSDGALWFGEPSIQSLGRITTAGVITHFAIPCGNVTGDVCIKNSVLIVSGPGGDLYVGADLIGVGVGIARFTTGGVLVATYPTNELPSAMTVGPDGKVWFGTTLAVGVLDPAAVIPVLQYLLPTIGGSNVAGIVAGPSNSVWFTEAAAGAIGRIDVTTRTITEYHYSVSDTVGAHVGQPRLITSAPDGTLWFNDSNSIVSLPPGGSLLFGVVGSGPNLGAIEEFLLPGVAALFLEALASPIVAPDGNLYVVSELNCCGWEGGIRRIGPPPAITTTPQPAPVLSEGGQLPNQQVFMPPSLSVPSDLTIGPDGNIWYTAGRCVPCGSTGGQDTQGNLIGVLNLAPGDTDLALVGVPADMSVDATSAAGATVTFTAPTAVDEETPPAVNCDHASGSIFPNGTTTVTCSATDADDTPSTVSASFTVTVTDTDLALTGVPANITVSATSAAGAAVTFTPPTAVDEEAPPTVICDHASGSVFANGTTTVTCSATDADDTPSTVSASFTVTVRDTDLALSGVPANITVNATSSAGATVTFSPPTAIDEETPPAVICDHASGAIYPIGTTTVTCSATDADDTPSTVSTSFTITVVVPHDVRLLMAGAGGFPTGGYGAFFIRVRNTGNVPTSGTLTFTDQLPAGLTYVGAFGLGWDRCKVDQTDPQMVTCDYNHSLPVNRTSGPLFLIVRVSAPAGTALTNIGTVTPLDATPDDNRVSVIVTVMR
jgi:uncharacterized repeat protein (TIGR01451 family)